MDCPCWTSPRTLSRVDLRCILFPSAFSSTLGPTAADRLTEAYSYSVRRRRTAGSALVRPPPRRSYPGGSGCAPLDLRLGDIGCYPRIQCPNRPTLGAADTGLAAAARE